MLNVPNCIYNESIPLKLSLTAPYKSVRDLEMIIELTGSSNEKLNLFDVSSLRQLDFDLNSCDAMQTKFITLKKFCGVCKFSESNILDRLDDELQLLNYISHHGPDGRISIDLFKYYFLDQSSNAIKITNQLYLLIVDNYDQERPLNEILDEWVNDNEFIKIKVTPMIEKIKSEISMDIESIITRLTKQKPKRKKVQPNDVLSLLVSKQNIVKEKKETKKLTKDTNELKNEKKNNKNKKPYIDTQNQLPGQLNIFEVEESDKLLSTIVSDDVDTTLSEQTEDHDTISKTDKNITDDSTSINYVSEHLTEFYYDDINTLSIISGTVFLSTRNILILSVQNYDLKITNYKLDPKSKETNDFLIHLFMNKNVLKIVDDLIEVKKFVNTEIFNTTLDISIVSKDTNIIHFYNDIIKNYSVDELENYKKNNIVKLHTKVNASSSANITLKVLGETDLFKNVIIMASKKKVFDKYNVKVYRCDFDTLELLIEKEFISIVVDYFLSIIRSELKRNKVNKEIEVVIK